MKCVTETFLEELVAKKTQFSPVAASMLRIVNDIHNSKVTELSPIAIYYLSELADGLMEAAEGLELLDRINESAPDCIICVELQYLLRKRFAS